MTQKKNTAKALLASILSLALCISMLVGTSFAWFTDTATTGVNTIVSGNLDVGLKYSTDMQTWQDAEASTEIFDADAKWEPGYTEVVYFQVENKGSLAFNYRIGTNLVSNTTGLNEKNEVIDLTKYIKFGIVSVTEAFANRAAAKAAVTAPLNFADSFVSENSLQSTKTATFAMVVFLPEETGNEANYRGTAPSLQFGVQVIASQMVSEGDSYGSDYDADATYPDFAFVSYTPDAEMTLAGENYDVTVPANAGLQTEDGTALDASDELVMKVEKCAEVDGNVTVEVGSVAQTYEVSLLTANGEKVEATTGEIQVQMNIGAGRTGEIKLYHYDTELFGHTYDAESGILTFTTKDFSPYTVVEVLYEANTAWYADPEASEFVMTSAGDLAGLAQLVDAGNSFAGKTFKLGADIDLMYAEWEAIGDISNPFSGSFDGQEHKISNLKITKATTADKRSENRQAFISSYKPVGASYIQNLTLENIDVCGGRSVGGLLGVVQGADLTTNLLTITNINFIGDIKMDCYYAAGALLATGETIKEISNITIDVSADSYISNLETGNTCTAMCIGSVGGWVKADVVDNIVSNLNVFGKDGGIGGLFGELMGQYSVAKLRNLNYTGKVTVVEIAGSDGEGCTYSIQGNSVSFTKYFNGLLVGTPRFSVVADEATCTSTGTLELHMLDGTVLTTNSMDTWYEDWAVDLFGASYDTAVSDYAKKSFSLNYAGK